MSQNETDTPSFADRLRALADLYDQHPDLPEPTLPVHLYVSGYTDQQKQRARDGLHAARRFTGNTPVVTDFHVEVQLLDGIGLTFTKHVVGSTRLVTKEVEEFVLDDEPGTTSDADRAAAREVNQLHSVSV